VVRCHQDGVRRRSSGCERCGLLTNYALNGECSQGAEGALFGRPPPRSPLDVDELPQAVNKILHQSVCASITAPISL
jgi:hypothetical protein